jgi:hypothetical protein
MPARIRCWFFRELGHSGVPASLVRAVADPIELAVLVEGAQPFEVIRKAVTRVLERVSKTCI